MRNSNLILMRLVVFITTVAVHAAFQISNSCLNGQYFDTTLLECKNCPTNMKTTPDGKNLNNVLYF